MASDAEAETPERDHSGLIDIERLPGGGYVTSIRSDLVTRYEGYLELDKEEMEEIERWGLGSIISHWLIVVLMLAAVLTGIAFWTGWYGPLDIGIWSGYQTAFNIHIVGGVVLMVLSFLVFPFYHKFVDGHSLRVDGQQLKEQLVIAFSFVGLVRYIPGYKKARRTYDEDRGEWAAYHPAQTVFWYLMWFFVGALTLTGFALWRELASDPAWWVELVGFMQGWVAYETMLQFHLISTFFVFAAIAMHAYFAITPNNWDILRSMGVGTLKGWRVDAETRPEPDGETTAVDSEGDDD